VDPERRTAELEFFDQYKSCNAAGSQAEQKEGFQGLCKLDGGMGALRADAGCGMVTI